jgi:hypothetical protein
MRTIPVAALPNSMVSELIQRFALWAVPSIVSWSDLHETSEIFRRVVPRGVFKSHVSNIDHFLRIIVALMTSAGQTPDKETRSTFSPARSTVADARKTGCYWGICNLFYRTARPASCVYGGAAAARAAQQATRTGPLLALTDDMVGSGLVASLDRPGGNLTGISILATELDGKRQEILMELVPAARRMAALADANTATPQTCRRCSTRARAESNSRSIWSTGPSELRRPSMTRSSTGQRR